MFSTGDGCSEGGPKGPLREAEWQFRPCHASCGAILLLMNPSHGSEKLACSATGFHPFCEQVLNVCLNHVMPLLMAMDAWQGLGWLTS